MSDTSATTTPHTDDATFRISRTVGGPLQTQSTTTFAALGDDKTHITIAWQPHASTLDETAAFKAGHAAMAQGSNASFEQLDAYLAQLPHP